LWDVVFARAEQVVGQGSQQFEGPNHVVIFLSQDDLFAPTEDLYFLTLEAELFGQANRLAVSRTKYSRCSHRSSVYIREVYTIYDAIVNGESSHAFRSNRPVRSKTVTSVTEHKRDYEYATYRKVTARVTPMLLSLMIVCAVGAALLFFLGAFDELRDIWTHPDHKDVDDQWHHPKPKG
jgi:hypothetical protein